MKFKNLQSLIRLCAALPACLLGMLLSSPDAHAYSQQSVALQSAVSIQRGEKAVANFYPNPKQANTIIRRITIKAPDGMIIVGVNANDPVCLRPSAMPTTVLTCYGNTYSFGFPIARVLAVTFQATTSADLGDAVGVAEVEQPAFGVTTSNFKFTVLPTDEYADTFHRTARSRNKRDVEAYWTEATMAAAKPMTSPKPAQTSTSTPGTAIEIPNFPTGAPSHSYYVQGVSKGIAPTTNSAVGILYFKDAKNQNSTCTAFVVPSVSGYLIATAAHCVSSGKGKDHYDFMFIPGYPEKRDDYSRHRFVGAYAVYSDSVFPKSGFNSDYDLAFVTMEPNMVNEEVEAVTGSYGLVFGAGKISTVRSIGYPDLDPGRVQCEGWTDYSGYQFFFIPTRSVAMQFYAPCKLMHGASGAPMFGWWIEGNSVNYPSGFAFSVQSTSTFENASPLFAVQTNGPYLGAWARKMYAGEGGLPLKNFTGKL